MSDSDYVMRFSTVIPSVANNLKNIYLGGPNCYEFTYDYYNDNNDAFGLLFQQNTDSSVENFYHPTIVNEWKSNM